MTRQYTFRIGMLASVITLAPIAPVAVAGMITTLFTANFNGGLGGAVYFDVDVVNPAGVEITHFDINVEATIGNTISMTIYTTPATAVGKEGDMAMWTLVASGAGQAADKDTPTPMESGDFSLPPGKYGMAIVLSNNARHRYTSGDATNRFYANDDLSLTLGAIAGIPFNPASVFRPYTWNGTIYYNVIDDDDGDGFGAAFDVCPDVANPGQEDADSDGVGDACDQCPNDPVKTEPGDCGCGIADQDANSDGTLDCLEAPPAGQDEPGCCAPGVFPTVGLFAPVMILGLRWRRRVRRT